MPPGHAPAGDVPFIMAGVALVGVRHANLARRTRRKAGSSLPVMDTLLLREFVRDPTGIAAVMPSSAAMAGVLSVSIPESGEPVVVELGAGTGACTGVIQHRLGGRGRHIAIEVNPTLAELLAKRCPNVEVVCGEAEDLPKFLPIGVRHPPL